MKPLKSILESPNVDNFKKLRLSSTSEGGRAELLNRFVLKIRTETKDNLFGGELSTGKEFLNLEKKLKDLIFKKLYVRGKKDWFKDAVDEETYSRALKMMKRKEIIDMKKIHLQIGLGLCFDIMRKNKNLFYPIFVGANKDFTFKNTNLFEAAISAITDMRNRIEVHYTGEEIDLDDEEIVKIFLDKINKCLDEELKN